MSEANKINPADFALHLEFMGPFRTSGNSFVRWTGTHWSDVPDVEIEREAIAWLQLKDTTTQTASQARSARQTAFLLTLPLPEPKDRLPVIPLLNGYLHIDRPIPVLEDFDQELGLRHVLACKYDVFTPPPVEFERFLNRILPDPEIRNRVQEFVGSTLLPDTRYQRAAFWWGSGANGKGVLARIVTALHPKHAAVHLDALGGFKMSGLRGASLVFCDEAPQRRIDEHIIKSAIAGETMQFDIKYHDPVSEKLTAKWLVLGNHLPDVTDQSQGFWRRFDIVPFEVTIPEGERDATLAERIIANELDGVLNWALEGLERLLRRDGFDPIQPGAMKQALQSARVTTDSLTAWTTDVTVSLTMFAETPKYKVYQSYVDWCRENGVSSLSAPKFWQRLPTLVGEVAMDRKMIGGERVRLCNVRVSGR